MDIKQSIKNIRNDPVQILIMFNNARGHIGILSFIMIGWMFILQTELNLIQTLAFAGVGFIVLMVFDWKYLYSNIQRKSAEKNPVLMEMKDDIKEVKNEIANIRELVESRTNTNM
jgi:hypothetical protein